MHSLIRPLRERLAAAAAVLALAGAAPALGAGPSPAISWNGWSDNLFRQARALDRPVFLYMQASWCLACREFEDTVLADPEVRLLIDQEFLALRVDRDLRPDIYARYRRGSVPSVAFLTPRGNSIFFQARGDLIRAGGSGFTVDQMRRYLEMVRKHHAATSGRLDARLEDEVSRMLELRNRESRPVSPAMVEVATNAILRAEDPVHGGLQGPGRRAERLPVEVSLRRYEVTGDLDYLQFARRTLNAMASSSIRDPLTGAFHQATRERDWSHPVEGWLLSTQADMLALYLDARLLLGDETYGRIAEELVELLLRRFFVPDPGVFRAAIYPAARRPTGGWSPQTLDRVLGKRERAAAVLRWDVPGPGDDAPRHARDAASVAEVADALGMPEGRAAARLASTAGKLREARDRHPGWSTDDSSLTGANGRAVESLLRAWAITGHEEARDAALTSLAYVGAELASTTDGAFHGIAPNPARVIPVVLLVDQLDLVGAWFLAYQLTADRAHLGHASSFLELILERFQEEIGGGFFDRLPTVADVGDLRIPDRRIVENARAAALLVEWSYLDPRSQGRRKARAVLESFADEFTGYGVEAAAFGMAVDRLLRAPVRIVVVDDGEPARAASLRAAAVAALPLWKVVLPVSEVDDEAFLRELGIPAGRGTAAWMLIDEQVRGPFGDAGALAGALPPAGGG